MKSILILLFASLTIAASAHIEASQPDVQFYPPLDSARDQLFIKDWKFHRGNASSAEKTNFNDSDWRTVNLPHDWSVEPVPPADPKEAIKSISVITGEWRFHNDDNDDFAKSDFDDSNWQKVVLPDQSNEFKPKSYRWFRKVIDISPDMLKGDIDFMLGEIVDCDEFYINGKKVGESGLMPKNQPQGECFSAASSSRHYIVPAKDLKPGPNQLAICVYSERKKGGFKINHGKSETVGPFTTESVGMASSGFTVGGTGWYRKHFKVDASDVGKNLEILFGGVYMNSDVWINGHLLGFNPYGYTSFYYDLTPFINAESDNVIAVRVRNEGVTSRWYPGSGIYRNVWLVKTNPTHIRQWGVSVVTPEANVDLGKVIVQTEVDGDRAKAELRVEILDAAGKVVATGTQKVTGEMTPVELSVAQPKLWNPETPDLYSAKVQLCVNGTVTDEVRQNFGIRTIRFTVENGFELNGKSIKMWGGCVHHDNGPLGAAAFARAETRKLEIMKAQGYNAVRATHNPMSDDFYDTCDRIGLLVMDEIFDTWYVHKTTQDYGGEGWEKGRNRDIELWLRRTRNHPSIVIRSLGNEVGLRKESEESLAAILQTLIAESKRWDNTRLFTAGNNLRAAGMPEYMKLYDVKGQNYAENVVLDNHAKFPDWVMIGTESSPSAKTLLLDWNMIHDNPWFTGTFVWTALEYIGESNVGWYGLDGENPGWPSYAAAGGLIDIIGYAKGGQLFRNVVSEISPIEINVLEPLPEGRTYKMVNQWTWPMEYPNWSWPGFEGKPVEVRVMSRAPQVRLLLNGQEVGTGTTSKENIDVVFKIPYQPGELVAEGLLEGKVVCRKILNTPGKAVALRLISDRSSITASGNDLAFVTVETVDAKGQLVQTGKHELKLQASGEGTLEACGNGNHKDVYSFRNPQACATWHGRELAILRPTGKAGKITLTVDSSDFPTAQLEIPVRQ